MSSSVASEPSVLSEHLSVNLDISDLSLVHLPPHARPVLGCRYTSQFRFLPGCPGPHACIWILCH